MSKHDSRGVKKIDVIDTKTKYPIEPEGNEKWMNLPLPGDLPKCGYRFGKIVEGERQFMRAYSGMMSFPTRRWEDDDTKEVTVGRYLRIDTLSDWYATSMLKRVEDHNDHLIFETMSGTLYIVEPMMDKEEYMEMRAEIRKQRD